MSTVRGLLRRALATLRRRPDDKQWQGRVREDLWTGEPLNGGNYGKDARVVADAEDAAEYARLEALLAAEGQPAKLDAEWLAAQEQIRETWST